MNPLVEWVRRHFPGAMDITVTPDPAAAAGAPAPPPAPPAGSKKGMDGFPLPAQGPRAEAHRLLEDFLREAAAYPGWLPESGLKTWESGKRLLAVPPPGQPELILAAFERGAWERAGSGTGRAVRELLARLLRRKQPLSPAQLREILDLLVKRAAESPGWMYYFPLRALLAQFEPALREPGADGELRPRLLALRKAITDRWMYADEREVVRRIDALLAGERAPETGGRPPELDASEPWAARLLADLAALDAPARAAWHALLAHLAALPGARPSAKWTKEARGRLEPIGADAFSAHALAWLAAVREGADRPLDPRGADLARGLAWLLADLGGDDTARALGDLALVAARKIPEVGQRSAKLTNACVAALGAMSGTGPLAQLTRVRAKVRYRQAQEMVESTLRAAAERMGVTPAELEELVVPTFGMEEPGILREEVGEWTAEVRVTGTATVETTWVRGGKRQKSAPAALKESHGDALKEVKQAAAEMEKALSAQRDRLEGLPMAGRALPYPAWRARYLDHPLLAGMSRRLVWRFEANGRAASGAWLDAALVDADDRPLEELGEETVVRPWHPVGATVDEVRGWRAWLERHGVTQPFKQAHRELYVLTDAERATEVYSNRFAAHILRQHQLAALARARGWTYHLQGAFDNCNWPTLRLPAHGLAVEYAVEPVIGDHGGDRMSAAGISLYVATDQVRFTDPRGNRVRLADVPPLVFSEAMRDVDLFVGVTSVGADPAWTDGGRDGLLDHYWSEYAFGDLSATAVTRREVLERLLPRLKIAPACALEERFLVVRGTLRTYRIHLGSGNILMEPNGQYLCIVPDRGSGAARQAAGLKLPFEGDSLLSVVLSKAFLLAADDRITDPTITRQITWRG